MKKLLMAGLLMAGLASIVKAEQEGNPDRYPSIGVFYTGVATDGDLTYTSSGFSTKQNVESSHGTLLVDGRFPVSHNVTLYGALGFIGSESTAQETNLLDGGKNEESGAAITIGVRFYIK